MTDLAAVFKATYSDFKLIRTRDCVQIVFEIPNKAELVFEALAALGGMPNPGSECWCAIARLNVEENPATKPPPNSPSSPDQEGAHTLEGWPARRMYARVGSMCKEPLFWRYVAEMTGRDRCAAKEAVQHVRDLCDVKSRKEIVPGSAAAEAFEELYDDYKLWVTAPDLARRG